MASFSATFSGSLTKSVFDVYDYTKGGNAPESCYLRNWYIDGLTLTIKNTSSSTIYIKCIDIFTDGLSLKRFKVENWLGNATSHELGAGSSISIPMDVALGEYCNPWDTGMFGDKLWVVDLNDTIHDTNGQKAIKVKIEHSTNTETVNSNKYISCVAPIISSININTDKVKKTFYKNEAFDYSNLVVTANYKYYVAGTHAYSSTRTDYSITTPSMSTTGEQTVKISYGGYSSSYNITVYGISQYIFGTPTKTDFKALEEFEGAPTTIKIKYEDGTEETTNVIVDSSSFNNKVAGTYTINLSAYATKTKETVRTSYVVTVYNLEKIELDTTNVQKVFISNSMFNKDHLKATAYFFNAGTLEVPKSQLPVTGYDMATPKFQTLTASYTYNGVTKSATYDIVVTGLVDMKIDFSDCPYYDAYNDQFRIPYTSTLSTANRKVYVKRQTETGVTDWTLYTGDVVISKVDTSVGEHDVTFTITENGIVLNVVCKVIFYKHNSLEITNNPTKFYIREGNYPTLQIGNMQVVAKCSDGVDETLTLNAATKGYTLSPTLGTQLQRGTNTISVRSTLGASSTFNVTVEENSPKEDATLIVEGTLAKTIYSVGETLDTSGITVKVSEMEGGETNYEVDFTATIVGKSSNTFTSADESKYYDILISVDGVTETYTLADAILLDGVASISNLTSSKTVFKAGETIAKEHISGTVNYVSGATRAISKEDITNLRETPFSKDDSGELTLSFMVCGITQSLTITVIKIQSLSISYGSYRDYYINDSVNLDNWTIKKKYTNNQEETLTKEEKALVVFTFDGEGTLRKLIPASRETMETEMTLEFTEAEETVTLVSYINIKALKSVVLYGFDNQPVEKLTFEYGNTFDIVDYVVRADFNDGTNEQFPIIDETKGVYPSLTETIKDKVDNCYVSYTYHGETMKYYFTTHCIYLSDISVDFSSISETQYEYTSLDLSGVTATRTISSTDAEDTNYPETSDITEDLEFSLNDQVVTDDYILPKAEDIAYVLKAKYTHNGQTAYKTMTLKLYQVILQSITLKYSEDFKDLTTYAEEENLNLNGLTIELKFNREESNTEVSYTNENAKVYMEGDSVNYISKTKYLSHETDDNKELTLVYTHNDVSKFAVIGGEGTKLRVAPKQLESISIEESPTKNTYSYGDAFTLEGLILRLTFNSGKTELDYHTSENISVTEYTVGYVFKETDGTFTKEITINYTYGDITKSVGFEISLVAPKIKKLKTNANDPNTPVIKTFTDLKAFSMEGLIVTAVMENDWEKVITDYTHDAAKVLVLDEDNIIHCTGNYGVKTITISATNPFDSEDKATTTYEVDIASSNAVKSAVLYLDEENFDPYNYLVGDTYTAKGVSFKVTDIDGNVWYATDFSTVPSVGTVLRTARKTEVSVTYINGDFVKTETYDITVSIANKINFSENKDYRIAIGNTNDSLFTTITHNESTIKLGVQEDGSKVYPIFLESKVSVDSDKTHKNTYGYNIYTGDDASKDCIGYMDLGLQDDYGNIIRNSHIVLFDDPINPIEGGGNITVTFPHYVPGYADKINNCTFGKIFNKRLFLSGNPNYKNLDWHSGEINTAQVDDYNNDLTKDYTYFSDLDYCVYGSDDTAVVGYDIYRDGEMIVFKESSRKEATLYKRQSTLIHATDYAGNVYEDGLYEEAYPCFDINSNGGEGSFTNRTIINFIGDTLFLTRNGLKLLSNKEKNYNSSKYSYDVSSYINSRILNEELENAHLFTFKERLILRTKRGVYFGEYNLRNDNSEYEWYFIDNVDADIFFEIDNELYFADSNGNFKKFVYDEELHIDKPRTYIGVGGALLTNAVDDNDGFEIDAVNNKIVVSQKYADEVVEGRQFHLITTYKFGSVDASSQIHAKLGNFVNSNTRENLINQGQAFDVTAWEGIIDATNNLIKIEHRTSSYDIDYLKVVETANMFYSGRKVYLDEIEGTGYEVAIDRQYTLSRIEDDLDNYYYKLLDDSGNEVSLLGVESMRISFVVNDLAITKITNVESSGELGKKFNLLGDHDKVLDLIYYNKRNDRYSGVITEDEDVKAFFVTKPYDLGTILYNKTISTWAVTNDTQLASCMDVGYLTSKKQGGFNTVVKNSSGSKEFGFDGFSFERIQFTSDNLPHIYIKNRMLPGVGFIRFKFENNEDSNMVLDRLSLIYTISQSRKGI